jgi:hypothetical protein
VHAPIDGDQVAQRKKQTQYDFHLTQQALALACLGGGGALGSAEVISSVLWDSETGNDLRVPNWRIHMGSICVGMIAFLITFFLLEMLGRKSKAIAWRSSIPWLPLIAFTGLATAIRIPVYVMIPTVALCSVWAYRRTRAVR